MSFRNSVTIVASPRPRVGKTLLARLLTDFHMHEGRSVAAFDLNSGEGTLAQFLPEHAAASAIGDIQGQMALFDRLVADDDTTKVVDLGHESFESFFALAEADRLCRGSAPPRHSAGHPVRDHAGPHLGRSLSQPAQPLAAGHADAGAQRDARPGAASRQISDRRQRRGAGEVPRAGAGLAQILSRSRRSRFRIRGSPMPRTFRSTCISSCNAGCGRFIWSSGNSTCAFCSPICNPRSGLSHSSNIAPIAANFYRHTSKSPKCPYFEARNPGTRTVLVRCSARLPARHIAPTRRLRHVGTRVFAIVLAIAFGFGLGAVVLESQRKKAVFLSAGQAVICVRPPVISG